MAYVMMSRVNGNGHRTNAPQHLAQHSSQHIVNNGPYANPRAIFQTPTNGTRSIESTTPKYSRAETPTDSRGSPAVSTCTDIA